MYLCAKIAKYEVIYNLFNKKKKLNILFNIGTRYIFKKIQNYYLKNKNSNTIGIIKHSDNK